MRLAVAGLAADLLRARREAIKLAMRLAVAGLADRLDVTLRWAKRDATKLARRLACDAEILMFSSFGWDDRVFRLSMRTLRLPFSRDFRDDSSRAPKMVAQLRIDRKR